LAALLAIAKRLLGILAAPARQFLAQLALQSLKPFFLRLPQILQARFIVAAPLAAPQDDKLQQDDDGNPRQ
jgi:hypothetical protein